MSHYRLTLASALFALAFTSAQAASSTPLLLQTPTISATEIAFSYGDDLWVVPRDGGEARRLATGKGRLSSPAFSPDGKWIAYTGDEDGNPDVFVIPAQGGEPRRLTFDPSADLVHGWTPDGQKIIFSSGRASDRDYLQLYTVSPSGGIPEKIPVPNGADATFSPDSSKLAYLPFTQWQFAWKNYRGGQTTRIWISKLEDGSVTKIPRGNSNEKNPMWIGSKIYFLSDRDGRYTLYSYDTASEKVTRLLENQGFDIKSAKATADAIVYDQVDSLHVYDLKSGKDHVVPVQIRADLPRARAGFDKVKSAAVDYAEISPSGKRALIQYRGEILSVPAEKGDARNLTQTPGVAERFPSWSPDGKWIAYFSDATGEYRVKIVSASGKEPAREFQLGDGHSFFQVPKWSPDSSKLLYTDKTPQIWILDIASGETTLVDTAYNELDNLSPSWSPDSNWITYAKLQPNYLRAVAVYSLKEKKTHVLTDGMSNCSTTAFDKGGKYLYFAASTNDGPTVLGDMSGVNHTISGHVYAIMLRKDQVSPLAPQSDEESVADDKTATPTPSPAATVAAATPAATPSPSPSGELSISIGTASIPAKAAPDDKDQKPKVEEVKIDLEGIQQRIVALPIGEANFLQLDSPKADTVYAFSMSGRLLDSINGPVPGDLQRYDLKERKVTPLGSGLSGYTFSANGEKILVARGGKWFITAADKEIKGEGELRLDDISVFIDPRQEWKQMFREAWRIERDYLYDPKSHGIDLQKTAALYEPFLDGIASRSDLNTLFREMTGWLSLGHTYIYGGANTRVDDGGVGLLGADIQVADGKFRIHRILTGENYNPDLSSPLTQPGLKISEGDYILSVNGVTAVPDREFAAYMRRTAGKQTVLKISSKADGSDAHEETVLPISSDESLRYRTWIEANRRRVEELSGGRLAYIHIPDTSAEGLTNFVRYYFSQMGKQGAIIDERFNHGGLLADYIVDMLTRPTASYIQFRDGPAVPMPGAAIHGPKVMLVNESSGSGGDYLPWYFRARKAGTIVGTRTWGGLVGIGGYPPLIDGGSITAPRMAIMNLEGEMDVENIGTPPDVEVEQDPKLVRQGRDPQLERAVAIALEQLEKNPPKPAPTLKKPDYSSKVRSDIRR